MSPSKKAISWYDLLVVDYAFEIVRRHCSSSAGDERVSHLAGFFGNAARRIAVLMGDRSRPKAGNDFNF